MHLRFEWCNWASSSKQRGDLLIMSFPPGQHNPYYQQQPPQQYPPQQPPGGHAYQPINPYEQTSMGYPQHQQVRHQQMQAEGAFMADRLESLHTDLSPPMPLAAATAWAGSLCWAGGSQHAAAVWQHLPPARSGLCQKPHGFPQWQLHALPLQREWGVW